MLRALGFAVLLVSGCAMPIPPEDASYGPRAGDSLTGLGASYSVLKVDDDADTETVDADISVNVSHFFEDQHEFGVLANVRRSEIVIGAVDIDSTVYSITPFYNFNVMSGDRTFFYVGPHAGVQLYDVGGEEDSSLAYGGHIGIRHFHSERVAVFVEPRYTRYRIDSNDVDDFSILLGLQYRF